MNAKEMFEEYLKDKGFNGLINKKEGCLCHIDKTPLCLIDGCEFGYLQEDGSIGPDKPKKRESLTDVRMAAIKKYKTADNTKDDFEIGDYVEIISPFEDMHYFNHDKGTITDIFEHGCLCIEVTFDKPRNFENGRKQEKFIFSPENIRKLDKPKKKKVVYQHFIKTPNDNIICDYSEDGMCINLGSEIFTKKIEED